MTSQLLPRAILILMHQMGLTCAAVYDLAQINRSGRTGIRSGDVRSDIDPSVENDPNVISTPPGKLASDDRSKFVERDEKLYRQKPKLI